MTLNEAQQRIDQWIQDYGVRYFHELTNLGILMEEVGEMSRHVVRLYGEQSYRDPEEEARARELLRSEMADVLWVLLCLANQMDVDMDQALEETLVKKTRRDEHRHIGNPKLKPSAD